MKINYFDLFFSGCIFKVIALYFLIAHHHPNLKGIIKFLLEKKCSNKRI